MYNKLLERQLNRFIKNKELITAECKSLFDAISISYDHYEQDRLLGQRSLEISSQEQHQYAIKIQEREERVRVVLEAASDGIIVVNEANEIEIYNSIAASIFRIDKVNIQSSDILSTRIAIHDSFGILPNAFMSLADFISSAETFSLHEILIFKQDGSILPVEVSTSDISNTSGRLKICIFRDITRRKELEKKISIRMEITRVLLESNSLDQVLPRLISKMSSPFGWDMGCFWLNDRQTMEMHLAYISLEEPNSLLVECVAKHRQMVFPLNNKFQDDLQTNNQSYFNNQLLDKPVDGEIGFYKYGLCSCLIVPVALKNNLYGIIELFSRKCMQKDDQLIQVFNDIGMEIAMFIEKQQAANRELELQKKLIEAARESGKSQIATSVLHNVGNALNTLNITISIFKDRFNNSELDNILKIADLFKQHREDLSSFLTHDPKGIYLPDCIIALSEWWIEEKEKLTQEFEKITSNLEHIKNVVSSQQRFSSVAGVKHKILVNNLLDDIITLKTKDNSINVIRQYEELPLIEVDKVKFLQILHNLICNAIDAVNQENREQKTITLKTEVTKDNNVRIHIIDNGCGIDPANAVKIFSYGFTTKKEGHGFGLHSSSILAEEMHGHLQASSPGSGKGSEFILTIPIN